MYCTAPTRFSNENDSLVSVRAPVGSVNIALEKCCVGRGLAAVRHKSGSSSFTYYYLLSIEDIFKQFESEGTVFGAINKEGFQKIPFVVSPPDVVELFEKTVGDMDKQITTNEQQSRTLSALRDTLLPKLLSGELEV